MPSAIPVKVATNAGDSVSYLRPNGAATDNSDRSQTRVFRHGSALYTITWDPYGDDDDGLSADYFKVIWNCRKSTNNGQSWSAVDDGNRIVGGGSGVAGSSDAVVQIGAKLWLIYTYGEHPEVSPGVFGYQFDDIRAVAFDCDTDTWGTPITGGPIRELTSTGLDFENLVADACHRGSDEIVVFHRETDETVSPRRAMYSVFDAAGGAWTSTDQVVFTSASSAHIEPDKCVFDETYVHFIARAGATGAASAREKRHRTLSGSTLSSETDMFAAWSGSWPPLSSITQAEYGFAVVHDGEVLFAQPARLYTFAPFTQWKVLIMRAPVATAAPSWTIEDIGSTDWDSAYAAFGDSGTPVFVEDDGELYCLHGGAGLYAFASDYRFSVYAQQYEGSGTWGAPVEIWNMQEAYGYGTSSRNNAFKMGAIGDLSGAALAERIGFVASLEQFNNGPYEDDTVYWFRAALGCCCADFAY